jgi:hypothetical protein
MPLFPGLSRGASDTKARTNGKTLASQPRLEDTSNNVKSTRLDDSSPDLLRASNADVDDALEGEAETVSGMFIKEGWVEGWLGLGGAGGGGEKTIDEGRVFWGRGRETEVLKNLDEALEAAVHRHDFADPWGSRGEVRQVRQRVEKGQRRRRVQSCSLFSTIL